MIRITHALVLICCLQGQLFLVTSENQDFLERIDRFVEAIFGCRAIVGLTLTVVKGNQTILTKGYGKADLSLDTNVTDHTLFSIASLSKAFASTLLAKVLDEHQTYNWETPVRDILGEDFYFDDAYRTLHLTLRDLLSHRTGVPGHSPIRFQDGLTRSELAKKIRFFDPVNELRTAYIYNNNMYGLMSHVTEIIAEKPWETLLEEDIFQPLGMSTSTVTTKIDWSKLEHATPYSLQENGTYREESLELISHWGPFGGSGSVMSNAVDMAEWLKLHINNGRLEDGSVVIPPEMMKETKHPNIARPPLSGNQIYIKPRSPESYTYERYAMGWNNGYYRGYPMLSHTGTSWGYGSLITLIPDLDIGLYTSVNGPDYNYYGRRTLHMYIMDLLMEETPWLNETSACEFPNSIKQGKAKFVEKTKKQTQSISTPELYIGTYGNFGYSNVSFEYDNSNLILRYGPYGTWYVYPRSEEHHFEGQGFGHTWSFTISSVIFSNLNQETNQMQTVMISFERLDPPLFERGLRMSDAPPPPDLDPPETDMANALYQSSLLPLVTILVSYFS